jgi:hypothetical protein
LCLRHVPVWDRSARHDGTFSRADFVFNKERNVYICLGGAELTSTGNIDQGHIVYYRANKNDWMRAAVNNGSRGRRIHRYGAFRPAASRVFSSSRHRRCWATSG